MKVITKRDLGVIRTLLLRYENLSGVTITGYTSLGKYGYLAEVRIPEEKEGASVTITKNYEPDMLVLADLNPPKRENNGFMSSMPRRYKVIDGGLLPASPNA